MLLKKLFRITEQQDKNIETYRKNNNLSTKAEALRHILSNLNQKKEK